MSRNGVLGYCVLGSTLSPFSWSNDCHIISTYSGIDGVVIHGFGGRCRMPIAALIGGVEHHVVSDRLIPT